MGLEKNFLSKIINHLKQKGVKYELLWLKASVT